MKLVCTPCSLRQRKGDSFYTLHNFATGSFLSLGAGRPGRETNTSLQIRMPGAILPLTHIQGVTGGKDQTSGGCSLC